MDDNSPRKKRGRWEQRCRYTQEPEKAPRIELQPRDKQILETVRKYRFITTKSLLMLYAPKGKGEKALRRRLALLFHHRYLTRRFLPPVDKGLGSAMSIYLLDTAGAEELLEAVGRTDGVVDDGVSAGRG